MLHFVGHFDVQPCAGFNSRTPAPPALDTAGFRPCPLLCPLLFFCLLPFCLPPAVASSFLPRAESHVDLYGPVRASVQPVRTPAGRRTARWPGLRGGNVTAGM